MDYTGLLKAMETASVMVVGDIMLDRFIYGDATRLSPEGPVPVLNVGRELQMLGGAGNVLSNLSSLKVKAYVFAIVGHDDDGTLVKSIAADMGADVSGLLVDDTRPTTVKTRFMANGHQLLRSDFEKTHALDKMLQDKLFAQIEKTLPKVKAVILSDYGKGVLGKDLLQKIIAAAHAKGLTVLVDPKGFDYTIYKGADIVTPNRKELSEATGGLKTLSDEDVVTAAQKLASHCEIATVIATRSEDGMTIVRGDEAFKPMHLRAKALEVFDVSGAGDTVIATVAAALAAGADLVQAATLANIAGGIVVGKVGTTPISHAELLNAVQSEGLSRTGTHPHIAANWKQAKDIVDQWKAKGLKVGFTGGCFDILHYGHVTYLNHASDRCDKLVVGLNHDVSVKLLKGEGRPVNDEIARATVIGSLAAVDLVVFFGAEKAGEDNTPKAVLQNIQPDIYFKGGDYTENDLPEAPTIHAYGGKIEIMNLYEGYSTTATIAKMRQKA